MFVFLLEKLTSKKWTSPALFITLGCCLKTSYNVVVPDFCAPIIKNEGNAGFEANPSVETNKLKKITLMLLIVITQPFSKLR